MTSFEQYTPRDVSALDALAAAKRTADAILRTNPLTNAVVSKGLMVWKGNHVDMVGDKTDYLWIGDFFPADTTLGGIPQKGFVLRRDDSTSGVGAEGTLMFAMYDHDPGGGGLGLRQTIHWSSLDTKNLWSESRSGGQQFPQISIPMHAGGGDTGKWPSVTSSTFTTILEGLGSCVGNQLHVRMWTKTMSATTGEFRVSVTYNGNTIFGVTYTQAAFLTEFREEVIDVSAARGFTMQVKLEGRVTSGGGDVGGTAIAFRNFTP